MAKRVNMGYKFYDAGLATLDGQLSLDVFSGAVCVSENILIFLFAAAGLDISYKMGIISPFPLTTRTKM